MIHIVPEKLYVQPISTLVSADRHLHKNVKHVGQELLQIARSPGYIRHC